MGHLWRAYLTARSSSGGRPQPLLFSCNVGIQPLSAWARIEHLSTMPRTVRHTFHQSLTPSYSSHRKMTTTTESTDAAQPAYLAHNPSIFSLEHKPYPSNSHPSATLDEQADTERVISELLLTTAPPALPGASGKSYNATGLPAAIQVGQGEGTVLRKSEHLVFFQSLFFKMPPPYVSLDASRPWLMYWTVHSWDLMGIALDQQTKDR